MPARKLRDLKPAFFTWAASQGGDLSASHGADALIGWMAGYYRAVSFSGRKQGTDADMLLFQTGSPPMEYWVIDVTRQLYKRRGTQLSLSISVPREQLEFSGYTTLWSRDADGVDDWEAQARAALAGLGTLPAGPVSVTLAAF